MVLKKRGFTISVHRRSFKDKQLRRLFQQEGSNYKEGYEIILDHLLLSVHNGKSYRSLPKFFCCNVCKVYLNWCFFLFCFLPSKDRIYRFQYTFMQQPVSTSEISWQNFSWIWLNIPEWKAGLPALSYTSLETRITLARKNIYFLNGNLDTFQIYTKVVHICNKLFRKDC